MTVGKPNVNKEEIIGLLTIGDKSLNGEIFPQIGTSAIIIIIIITQFDLKRAPSFDVEF